MTIKHPNTLMHSAKLVLTDSNHANPVFVYDTFQHTLQLSEPWQRGKYATVVAFEVHLTRSSIPPALQTSVHGVATKFCTREGSCDWVGNDIAGFLTQVINDQHQSTSIKPEPRTEVPLLAARVHNNSWDFVGL